MIKKIILLVFFLFQFFPTSNVRAQEETSISSSQGSIYLFWGVGCPHCKDVEEYMEDEGIDEILDIELKEIYNDQDNASLFLDKVNECGLPQNRAGVPMLYFDGTCWMGKYEAIAGLESIMEGERVESPVTEDLGTQETSVEEEEGNKNTVIMLVGIPVLLFGIILLGYLLKGNNKKKTLLVLIFLLSITSLYLFIPAPTYAVCPVCTAAVGVGLGLSRYFGIDDLIMSLWIGGVVLSMTISVATTIRKKTKIESSLMATLISGTIFYSLLFVTLSVLDITGNVLNRFWGVDKIVLGTVIGSLFFAIGATIHFYIKKRNDEKSLFPFQKVIIPVGFLWLASVVFYFILN